MRRFFAALERLDCGQSSGPVRILQIGDSHTANDAFSGRMREALQARFGAAGRGWLPGGIPFLHYRPQLVRVAQTGWRQHGIFDGAHVEAIGLDAAIAQSEGRNAQMTLVSTEVDGFSRFAVEFLTQPDGGTLSIRVEHEPPVRISTAALDRRAMRRDVPIAARSHQVELRTTDERQVHLIGWTTERHGNGIIYENHGTIGATVNLLGQMSATTVAYELSDSCPSLVVIAFGTNEGFDAALDLQAYRASFATPINMLAAHAPQAAILVVGPPDGNLPDPPGLFKARRWRKPRNLAGVRRIQREIAVELGCAFWDWSQAMGGTGSMHRLVVRDPPLALPDHMHLNKSGYAATADVLLFDLISAYERWRNRRSAS